MQRRHIFDVFLMRIKCVVKNVIIFDLTFDTNQKKSKSNFLCSVVPRASPLPVPWTTSGETLGTWLPDWLGTYSVNGRKSDRLRSSAAV